MSTPQLAELTLIDVTAERFVAFIRRLYEGDPGYCATLGFTLQSQTGKDGITLVQPASGRTPAGTTTVSAADLDVTTITAGFTWRY